MMERLKARRTKIHHKLNVREWHKSWLNEQCNGETAVAAQSLMKSRAPRPAHLRMRVAGGGRRHKAVIVRQELYEWYASIRFAIDWKRVIEENRSRGLKKTWRGFPDRF